MPGGMGRRRLSLNRWVLVQFLILISRTSASVCNDSDLREERGENDTLRRFLPLGNGGWACSRLLRALKKKLSLGNRHASHDLAPAESSITGNIKQQKSDRKKREKPQLEENSMKVRRLENTSSTNTIKKISVVRNPEMVILVYDLQKKKNIGTIIRSAVAFGVSKMLVVGQRRNLKTFGHQRTKDFMKFIYFEKFDEAVEYLKSNGFTIFGCEIAEGAKSVVSHPFTGNTAFIFGNEGNGLNKKAMKACDKFIYIPQYGHGTASLNVAVAASIVLHHFSVWAKYEESSREGFKFVVDTSKKFSEPHVNFKPTEKDLKRAARIAARNERLKESKESSQSTESTSTQK